MTYKGLTQGQLEEIREYLLERPAFESYELLLILDTAPTIETYEQDRQGVSEEPGQGGVIEISNG